MKTITKLSFLCLILSFTFHFIQDPAYAKPDIRGIPLGFNPAHISVNPVADIAVVSNEKDATVSIVDLETGTVIDTIPVGKFPDGTAVDHGLNIALVANRHDHTVSIIDLDTRKVVLTIPVGEQPERIAVNQNTHIGLATNRKGNTISVIDLNKTGIAAVSAVKTIPVGHEPIDVAIDPGLNIAVVVNQKDWNVSIMDLNDYHIRGTIKVGKKPGAIDINPETHLAVVANEKDNTVTVIDLSTLKTYAIPVGKHPIDVAINRLDNRALVICDEDREQYYIDLETGEIITIYSLNKLPKAAAINNLTNIAGVVDQKTDSLTLIQLPNPVPHIESIEPRTLLRGSSGADILIKGSKFLKASTVLIQSNTAPYTVTPVFTDNHTLQVKTPAAMLEGAGTYLLTVTNPGPEGGASNAAAIVVENPVPQISAIDPLETTAGTPGMDLTVYGAGIFPETTIKINGETRPYNLINKTKLELGLTPEDLEEGGYLQITASNPAPGGGASKPATFTVNNPAPVLTSITPMTVTAGGPGITLTATGDNFVKTSAVTFKNMQYPTTYINGNQLKTNIPSSAVLTAGEYPVTVTNPEPGGGTTRPLTFTVKPALQITITSPADGETINKAKIIVKGTFKTNTRDVGITVNSIIADIIGGEWIAAETPLTIGTNTITATIKDNSGKTATAAITVTATATPQPVKLTANIASGIPPLKTCFTVSTDMPNPVKNYKMDYEGDGVPDYTAEEIETVTHTYTEERIHYPTVTVTDQLGYTYTDTIAITVIPATEIDALLKEKWEKMKMALSNQDIAAAVKYFDSESALLYKDIFTAVSAQLPKIVQDMQEIQLIHIKDGVAKYRIRKNELYGGRMLSVTYYIYFVIDENGIWKIERF